MQVVPLDTSPNQNFDITLTVNGANVTFNLGFSYIENTYWTMTVKKSGTIIATNIPLLYGQNLLVGLEYLQIGTAYILKTSDIMTEVPDDTNLGSDFILVWGDNA